MESTESIGFRKPKTPEKEKLRSKPIEEILTAETAKEIPEIKNPEIAELEKPMKKILQGMKEHIDKGEYSVILGEDASGRLPALLFHQILTTLYKEKKLPSPKIETLFFSGQNPETLFFAGQRISDSVQKEKIVKKFKNFVEMSGAKEKAENKKILFVTEGIQTGKNLFPFMNALRTMKMNFDIATISLLGGEFKPHRESIEQFLGGKIFWGQGQEPAIFGRYDIGGVEKDTCSPFAKLFPPQEALKGTKRCYSQKRAAVRQDIKILAEKLVKWYKEKNSDVDK